MRFIILFMLSLVSFISIASYKPQDSDIIFQSSQSRKSLAVEQATNSPYSHMGIIFIKNGKPYDIWFGWDNNYIYCSELIWKIYDKALKLKIGQLQTIKDFNLHHLP
ncbi:Permuted papain-like amidase enzyme, YaeF/YiiX, C92 family [Gilliamella bombicola]|uniref:Permuted papain-like amidase enzyme, YaeF/YiiX, C92 family n=1 Tax=Gilliamella bombicola TaxID=1798182 RepID=A0A1C4BE02_9GAMM|nr:YiiX/YebB-like N1pC/P60 family cysteine hydrolase [Gilliamella bombicola]SCC05171.1 Permuted papain-like amidase enzyme, YaeF/YiiX, C92 family [Gilliamella bombicola]